MKRILLLALMLLLVGCSNIPNGDDVTSTTPRRIYTEDKLTSTFCVIFKDRQTGHEYLVVKNGPGIAIVHLLDQNEH